MSLPFKNPEKKILSKRFVELHPLYKQLIKEVRFVLEKGIEDQGIKIHGIQDRVKDFDSFYKKIVINRITDDPFKRVSDIAGIRIICLYRSDLSKIGKIIHDQLEVVQKDLKTEAARKSEFGYMSDHYVVRLPREFKGTRYNNIRRLKCEIQVRTISMDAWASVSHHLDYKQEIDIPSHLKKDFYALSGLFHITDTLFEMFKDSVERLKSQLAERMRRGQFDLDQEMNLNTLRAYLAWKLPDREESENSLYSELLYDLKLQRTGYSNFGKLDEALNKSARAVEAMEKDLNVYHTRVHFVWACLEMLDPGFLSFVARKYKFSKYLMNKLLDDYRALIKSE